MKKRVRFTLFTLAVAFCCAFGMTACGETTPTNEPTALEKADIEYYKVENMHVTVTDSRVTKYGKDYSATVDIDYANKAAHAKGADVEYYYDITGEENNRSFIVYFQYTYDTGDEIVTSAWDKIDRSDIYDTLNEHGLFNSLRELEVHMLANWIEDWLPTSAFADTTYSKVDDSEDHYAFLRLLYDDFSEGANGYSGQVCLNINTQYHSGSYPCAVTIQLNEQGRYMSCELDFGTNGKITATYSYGTASVTVPEAVRNVSGN